MSLRTRSSLIAGLVTLVISMVLGAGLLAQGYAYEVGRKTEQIATAARRLALLTAQDDLSRPIPTVSGEMVQVVSDEGKVLNSTADLAGEGPLTSELPPAGDFRWDGVVRHDGKDLLTVGFRVDSGDGPPLTVYVATPKPGLFYDPAGLLTLAIASLVGVGSVTLLTRWLVSRALRPVEAIRDRLGEITASDPHGRVPEPERQDEISDLATTVNQTLDRLDDALSQQRRFVADASHELRSPITGLRAEVDLAIMETAEGGPEHQALQTVDRAADRLQLLVEDLLAVARLDAGMEPRSERVDLGDVIRDELARRHPGKSVLTDLDDSVIVEGDRLHLTRVLVNLLDNGLRHAESAVWIKVSADREAGEAVLEVGDDGAGLAPEDHERVFQRFTRLAEGRSRDPGGSGLGLPIAREIAARHGGSLTVRDRSVFVLRLPLLTRSATLSRPSSLATS
ncbi:HAMP domain-containing histidine kinase [Nonomuraea sp. NBC_01738]|uniref:sensor histidine kinase n=1 Tax=Nonomuraea sp. NBC_01738 TaxID=2976003 RepID=UPI002E100CB0|nr:HAMP domain-containing histidine kinase [Nonomuraea sp. NBC_01738]